MILGTRLLHISNFATSYNVLLMISFFAGDGPDVPRRGHLHPRPDHQCHRGAEGIRRHGRLVLRGVKHLRRHRRVNRRKKWLCF